nr:hypothetical protein [Cystobacter sp.]
MGPTLVLPEPHVPRRALLRGVTPPNDGYWWARSGVLEGSADGETWHLLADFSDRLPEEPYAAPVGELYLDLALTPAPEPVRHVRLRFSGEQGEPVWSFPIVRELSLFD